MDELFDGSDAHLLDADQYLYILGERQHISTIDCWCKPYQDEICPNVWIHNDEPVGNA